MAERDYSFKVAKRPGAGQEEWDNYRRLKNLTNRKIKAAEALYYKNLIESAEGPKEMWRSLNSVLGEKKTGSSVFELQDRKRFLSEPKAVASTFNKFFATIGIKVANKLRSVARDTRKKYESIPQTDVGNHWKLRRVGSEDVRRILRSLKIKKAAGLDKKPARLVRDAEAELAPSITQFSF